MTRPRPQVFQPFHPSNIKRFPLQEEQRREIAAALGLSKLPSLVAALLELEIGTYKQLSSRPKVTPKRTIAAIDNAQEAGLEFEKALRQFTDIARSGVDAPTYFALTEFAGACSAAISTFLAKAGARKKELAKGSPPKIENQPLQELCGRLQTLFEATQEAKQGESGEKRLIGFVLTVLEAANVPCEDYRLHPSRLKRLFHPSAKSPLMLLGRDLRQAIIEAVE
jgi:hypothetical protein